MTAEALPDKDLYERIFEDLKSRETNEPLTCADLARNRPTFYLYGTQDRVLRPYWASCFTDGAPEIWRVERLDGVGHTPILEAPEETAKLYLEFLQAPAHR